MSGASAAPWTAGATAILGLRGRVQPGEGRLPLAMHTVRVTVVGRSIGDTAECASRGAEASVVAVIGQQASFLIYQLVQSSFGPGGHVEGEDLGENLVG